MKIETPPEAASKELVAKAFQWHQSQPQAIRDMVRTKEQLVALYRQHQRSEPQNDAPVSSKVFVSELKDLAKGIEAFENEETLQETPLPETLRHPTPAPQPAPSPMPSGPVTETQSVTFSSQKVTGGTQMGHNVDPRTRQMLTEVRLRMNLSTDSEALRVLVAIGYEKISKI